MMTDLVVMQNGEAVTSSLKVAEVFEKEHKNILRDIKGMFNETYFIKSSYVHPQNKQVYPMYYLTKEGFLLLTSSYRGNNILDKKLQILKEVDMVPPALPKRKEKIFSKKLTEFFQAMDLEIKEQFAILDYKVDFYIGKLSLIIEYDEPYHNSERQQRIDKEREEEILSHKKCNFLRLKSEDSDEYNLGVIALKLIELKTKK